MTQPPPEEEFVTRVAGGDLTGTQRITCAEIIYSALPQFYKLFPLPKPEIVEILSNQIGKSGTEFEECYACWKGSRLLSFITAVPAERLPAAKKGGLFALMRKLRNVDRDLLMPALSQFESTIDRAPEEGLYLARLGTGNSPEAFGSGTRLLRRFLNERREAAFSLHVHRTNPASWMYGKLGFRPLYSEPREFCCMVMNRTF
jgi:hypothetical protein